MPNWCEHDITITGPAKDLDAFWQEIGGSADNQTLAEAANLLDVFMPIPEDLADTTSPARPVSEDEYAEKLAAWEKDKESIMSSKPFTAKMLEALVEKYGTDNWYDWQMAHWGCKWGFCNNTAERRPRSIFYQGSVPWGFPEAGLEDISRANMTLKFDIRFYECGMAFRGHVVIKGGKIIQHESGNYSGYRGG